MFVTVNICTYNRAALLRQTLEQFVTLEIPAGVSWELLVVNNCCTDETDRVLAEFSHRLPLVVLHEKRAGKCYALNTAVASARGELILFTDDDVLVEPQWLSNYVRAASQWPDAAIFGGEITPWFERTPPAWVKRNLASLHGPFVINIPRNEDAPLMPGASPFGANMAARTSIMRQFRFDPRLGPKGRGMRKGDDTEMVRAILEAGHTGRWVHGATLKHFVVAERMRTRYLYDFYRAHSEVVSEIERTQGSEQRFPWWAVRMWCEETCVRFLTAPTRSDRWFSALRKSAFAHGRLRGYYSANRLAKLNVASSDNPPTPIPAD